ncbi:MAG: substrate-binding domain-containing protein [Gammaproteobacteria bacterium]|nr:substrate-binding domain-containing protein [Gammaproteobacteria bacterium]
MRTQLQWPVESSQSKHEKTLHWNQAESNLCLDFHGNPLTAKLVVFSDGNHHMALQDCCQLFLKRHPQIIDIFYATTPPRVILQSVLQGDLMLGNLNLNIQPDVFISPPQILNQLVSNELMNSHQAFAKSRGNVLLVKKGNPKNILGIADLLRSDVQLTLSNPVTEAASYEVYQQTLLTMAEQQGLDKERFSQLIDKQSTAVVFGESIHHREIPQTIFSGQADVAVVYHHLALRYTRIFPEHFELVELNSKAHVCTDYHIGLINKAGEWGQKFLDFMLSADAISLYQKHGLQAAQNTK